MTLPMKHGKPMEITEIAFQLQKTDPRRDAQHKHLNTYINAVRSRIALGWSGDELLLPMGGRRSHSLLNAAYDIEEGLVALPAGNTKPMVIVLRHNARYLLRKWMQDIGMQPMADKAAFKALLNHLVRTCGWPKRVPLTEGGRTQGVIVTNGQPKWNPAGIKGPLHAKHIAENSD